MSEGCSASLKQDTHFLSPLQHLPEICSVSFPSSEFHQNLNGFPACVDSTSMPGYWTYLNCMPHGKRGKYFYYALSVFGEGLVLKTSGRMAPLSSAQVVQGDLLATDNAHRRREGPAWGCKCIMNSLCSLALCRMPGNAPLHHTDVAVGESNHVPFACVSKDPTRSVT